MSLEQTTSDRRATARAMGYGLGWFSIALGLGELLGPKRISRGIGSQGSPNIFRAYGLREILTGVAILNSREPNKMVWGRVAGDVLDLVTLAPTLRPENRHRTAATGAVGFVAGATLLDIYVASLDGRPRTPDRLDLGEAYAAA